MPQDKPNRWGRYGHRGQPQSDESSKEHDVGALQRAHEDSRFILKEHLGVFSEQAEKAGRVVQADGVFLTLFVYVGSSSQTSDFLQFINCFSVPGLVFVLIGAGLALREQSSQEIEAGVSADELKVLENRGLSEEGYLRWVLQKGYARWIPNSAKKTEKKAQRVWIAMILSFIGLLLILAGMFIATQ